jgi:hypothetical protein
MGTLHPPTPWGITRELSAYKYSMPAAPRMDRPSHDFAGSGHIYRDLAARYL